jgi:Tfp pilus assembly protein PilN
MRAVNLIPAEQRSGGGLDAGRSGGAVYVLLGGLAMFAVLIGVWAMTGSRVSDRKAELQRLQTEVAAAQAQSAQLQGVDTIRALREQRAATVRALAAARVDWASSLDAIARTLPEHTWLSKLSASSVPGGAPGGAGAAGAVASSTPGASVQIAGCSPSQATVARLMPRLRSVPGVANVTLVRTQKADAGSTGAGACGAVDFEMVLLFAAAAPEPAPAAPAAAAPAAAPAVPATPATPAIPAPVTPPSTPEVQG